MINHATEIRSLKKVIASLETIPNAQTDDELYDSAINELETTLQTYFQNFVKKSARTQALSQLDKEVFDGQYSQVLTKEAPLNNNYNEAISEPSNNRS